MSKKILQAAAGAGGESVYVEDVFSTYLYEGTGSALDITNNIDLSGEGGAVWIKNRTNASNHALFDTERGAEKLLFPDDTAAEQDRTADNDSLGAFNSDGFSLQASSGNRTNESGSDFVSWSFRKQAGFFDVVAAVLVAPALAAIGARQPDRTRPTDRPVLLRYCCQGLTYLPPTVIVQRSRLLR